jgi:hypothetical protein
MSNETTACRCSRCGHPATRGAWSVLYRFTGGLGVMEYCDRCGPQMPAIRALKVALSGQEQAANKTGM